jgi:hypothetical protein
MKQESTIYIINYDFANLIIDHREDYYGKHIKGISLRKKNQIVKLRLLIND